MESLRPNHTEAVSGGLLHPDTSQQLRHLVFEQCPDLLCVLDAHGDFAEHNPEWTRTLGWSREDLIGSPWINWVHPSERQRVRHLIDQLLEGAYVRGAQARLRHRDGTYRWLSWNAHGDPDSGLVFLVARDITTDHNLEEVQQTRQSLEALVTATAARLVALTSDQLLEGMRRSLREIGDLLSLASTFLFVLSEERDSLWRVAEWTQPGAPVDLSSVDRLAADDVRELLDALARFDFVVWTDASPLTPDRELAVVSQIRAAGARSLLLMPLPHPDGTMGVLGLVDGQHARTWIEPELALLRMLGQLYASSLRRRHMETELLESEERFRNVVQECPMGMHMLEITADNQLRITGANPAAERITGLDNRQIVGQPFEAVFPQFAANAAERYRLAAALGIPWQAAALPYEGEHHTATWELYCFQTSPGRVATMFLDVTDRRHTEHALRASEQRLRATFDAAINVAFVVTDARQDKPVVLEVSPGAERIFGYERGTLQGQSIEILHVPSDRRRVLEAYSRMREGGPGFSAEMTLLRQDGKQFPALTRTAPLQDEDGNPYGVLSVSLDISEQRELEAFLRQSQKMEALGTLASGIAHDFNNILGAMIGYSELARLHLPGNSPVSGHLEQVLAAANRARDLVTQILAFSRRTSGEVLPLELGPIVREALRMLRASIPSTIAIQPRIRPCGPVLANPTQVHQVLMNLCTNAAHAMRESGGELRIELAEEELEALAAAELPGCRPGPYVRMTVADTGTGIAPEHLPRIFDPYFTTKEKGVGTGLGLAVVHGIVKGWGGALQVASEIEAGTAFDVYIPRATAINKPESVRPTPLPTGHERILLVDDEEALAFTARRMLERLGYGVTVAVSARDALDRFLLDPDHFDLVISDQTMPQLTGDRLLRRILEVRPDIPVILCTGYSEAMSEEAAKKLGVREYLMKPVAMRTLALAVRTALDFR